MSIHIVWDSNWQNKLKDQLEPHLNRIADEILEDMKDECPVDTGALRDSLMVEKDNHEYRIGSRDKDYSVMVENGTRFQAPKHFMRNALYKKRD